MEKLKKYPKYKPSGVEWIGEIPDEWDVIKLKYALDSLESGSRETGGGSIAEGIFSIGGEHIGWLGELLLENPKYVSEDYYNNLKNGKIIEDDVLLVKDGATIGKCSIVKSLPFEKCAVNEHVFILRANKNFSADFIFNFIWCRIGQEQILLNVRGSAQPGLNSQFKNEVLISVPPRPEQTAIANYLDDKTAKIDTLIEKKKILIELLKEERTAVINQAVTKGLNHDSHDLHDEHDEKNQGNPLIMGNQGADRRKLKDSGIDWLGQIPAHWEVKKLKYLGYIRYGLGQPPRQLNTGLPLIRATNVERGKIIEKDLVFVDPEDVPFERDPVLKENDIIVVRSGAYTADSAIVPQKYEGAISGYDMVLRVYNDNPFFISYCLLSNYVLVNQLYLQRLRAAQPHLNKEELGETFLLLPDTNEQYNIVQQIETETKRIDEKIARAEKEIELLQEYRTALISEVVTGKIKVC